MRRRLIRASSFLVVAALALGVGTLAVGACSSFDATPGAADGNGGALDAGPAEASVGDATAEAAADASGDGDAACGALLGADFIKDNWTLGGSAMHTGNFILVLTGATGSQGGLAWHAVNLPPMRSFRAKFTLRVTTTDVAPADGMTFFWSGDAPPIIGGNGNLLGYCDGVNGGAVALLTSLVAGNAGVPSSNVVVKHEQDGGSCVDDGPVATTAALAAVDAGVVSAVIEIVLDGPAAKITVRRDGMTVIDQQPLEYVPDQINSIGFTAATGNNYASHEIKDFELTSCP